MNGTRKQDGAAQSRCALATGSVRTVSVQKLYHYKLKTGQGIGVIGYQVTDVDTNTRIRVTRNKRDAIRWCNRRKWIIQ